MKKLVLILLIVSLVLILCACNSSPDKNQSPDSNGNETPAWHEGSVLDSDDPYYADGLNDFGLPDISRYTISDIYDMYVNPDKWDVSVLYMTDGSFDFEEDLDDYSVYSDPDVDPEYIFDLGEWRDYNPGNWTPGPDEITQFDIDWSEFEDMGEYDPSILVLPEEYAFLVPGGLRSGDMAINDEDGLQVSLQNRTADDYAAIVKAANDHDYTIDAQTIDQEVPKIGRMCSYSANNGTEEISIVYQNNSVTITVEDIEEDEDD